MRLYFDCLPCIVKQINRTVKKFIDDEEKQFEIVQRSIESLNGHINKNSSAPILTGEYLEVIKEAAVEEDIYLEEKNLFNQEMLALEEEFKEIINESDDSLKTAFLLSGAANIIDFGVIQSLDKEFVKKKILKVIDEGHFSIEISSLLRELNNAGTLTYIGDNCGEAVLDKLVLEVLKDKYPRLKIFYVVRDIPVLNDVTRKEAYEIGLNEYAEIISSGSRLPGTILERCSDDFRRLYNESDVKILKGMGNLETAGREEEDAYFIFMVKCKFMSRKLKSELYKVILTKGNPLYR